MAQIEYLSKGPICYVDETRGLSAYITPLINYVCGLMQYNKSPANSSKTRFEIALTWSVSRFHLSVCWNFAWINTESLSSGEARKAIKAIIGLNSPMVIDAFHEDPTTTRKLFDRVQYIVETLYSTIYYSKYFIELNFDKSTQYVALWTHKRHPILRPFGRAMECLLWVLQQKLTVL